MLVDSKVIYRIEPFYFQDDYDEIQLKDGFQFYHFSKQLYYQHIQDLFYVKNQHEKAIAKTFKNDWNQVSKITFENSLDDKEVTPFPKKECVYRYYLNYEKDNGEKTKRCIYFKVKNVQIIASMSQVGMVIYEFIIDRITEKSIMDGELSLQEVDIDGTPENYEWAVYALRNIQEVQKNHLELQVENKKNKEERKRYFKERNFELPEPENIPYLFKPFDWSELTNAVTSKMFKETYGFAVSRKPGKYALMYTGAVISQPDIDRENQLANHLFKISRGYKQTYYKQADLRDLIKPFDNVWWYFSDEGAASFVLEVEDPAAMSFFESQYTSKWSTSFLYLYLLVLIQRFSFIHYTIKTNEYLETSILYKRGNLPIDDIKKELLETRKLYRTILKFQIQASHEHVSQLTHYNVLYNEIRQVLRIPNLVNELNQKLDTFSRVIESVATEKLNHEKQKQEEQEKLRYEKKQEQIRLEKEHREQVEKKRQEQFEKQNSVIQTITYIFLPATLTTGILGMNIPFIKNSTDLLFLLILSIVIASTAIMSIGFNKKHHIKSKSSKIVLVFSVVLIVYSIFLMLENY